MCSLDIDLDSSNGKPIQFIAPILLLLNIGLLQLDFSSIYPTLTCSSGQCTVWRLCPDYTLLRVTDTATRSSNLQSITFDGRYYVFKCPLPCIIWIQQNLGLCMIPGLGMPCGVSCNVRKLLCLLSIISKILCH